MRLGGRYIALSVLILVANPRGLIAQEASAPPSAAQPSPPPASGATVCNLPIPPPANDPPPGSGPVVFQIVPCFRRQGNVSMVEPQTYLYYIKATTSRPSQNEWAPYDEAAVNTILEDFTRLWATGFLDDLSIDVTDYVFSNGVVGKLVTYDMEERQRIKIVNYEGSKHLEQSKLEEKLRDQSVSVKLDTFVDEGQLAKVKTTIGQMLAEQGYPDATVHTVLEPMPGAPKLVHLTFKIDEGPKIQISKIHFEGNKAFGDRELEGAMTKNHFMKYIPFLGGGGTYKQSDFDEDSDKLVGFYRDHGYVSATVGEPQLETLEDSKDGKTRSVRLNIPIVEGSRYKIGSLTVDGNASVKSDYLLSLFKLHSGDFYSEGRVRDGINKARDVYGMIGRFEFTGYPDLKPTENGSTAVVDVVLRMQEGEQYFINRIIFEGNTFTKDRVIRRELRVYEGAVFNTEALKQSVRRLNQLGYFKPLEDQKDVHVEKLPDTPTRVNLNIKLQEQNRNQITFGAGLSQLNGPFVDGSFSTSNFLGAGETLSLSVQTGSRSNAYSAGITEPYVLGRPISAGVNLFSSRTDYYLTLNTLTYSQVREGAGTTFGLSLRPFTRLFAGYTYEVIDSSAPSTSATSSLAAAVAAGTTATKPTTSTTTTPPALTTFPAPVAVQGANVVTAQPPTYNYALDAGRHTESRVEPTIVHDTVDSPITPRRGIRINLSSRVAGSFMGGNVSYIKPEAETTFYVPQTKRLGFGVRGQIGYLHPYGATSALPYYLRYFLGGEQQIRGVDIQTVGPISSTNVATGGNKFLLFNAEYYFDVAGPVRILAFHDAGQAFDEKQRFNLLQLRTSSGVELRVFVPILNVPMRLIYAWNIYRDPFQPKHALKFAVGSTF